MADEAWKRLGQLLVQRRTELGYPKRLPWVRDVLGLSNDRIQSDLENARRDNYDQATLYLVEQQYQWEPGSIEKVLAGGQPDRMPGTSPDNRFAPPGELDVAELNAMYGEAIIFSENVRRLDPERLEDQARAFLISAATLFADAVHVIRDRDEARAAHDDLEFEAHLDGDIEYDDDADLPQALPLRRGMPGGAAPLADAARRTKEEPGLRKARREHDEAAERIEDDRAGMEPS